MAATRGQKLDESLTYQQFLVKVESKGSRLLVPYDDTHAAEP